MINKMKQIFSKHPIITQFALCTILGLIFSVGFAIYNTVKEIFVYGNNVGETILTNVASIFIGALAIAVLIFPFVVTIYEILYLISTIIKERGPFTGILRIFNIDLTGINNTLSAIYDVFILFVGVILELLLLDLFHEIRIEKQWFEQLYNEELHAPVNTDCLITFAVLCFMFVVGLAILTVTSDGKHPPLVTVLSISLMYMGVIESLLYTVQLFGMNLVGEDGVTRYKGAPDLLFTVLIPLNMILMLLRIMYKEIKAYKPDENRMSKIENKPFLAWCSNTLGNSKNWPVIALVMMIPLLGIIIAVLALFGQAPDAAIKAFTETANYTFSMKIPPQNLTYDEHYLCTVAAGGHKKIVKPIRMGKRHGHDVVVNRQLLIANAFEQILEEKTPKFHRVVRNFYDKYGFPVARLIKSKYIADVVWFIMKPLEWIFLIVIYLTDVNPEDRIASQYI